MYNSTIKSESLESVQPDSKFLGKTIADAAMLVLTENNAPLSPREIVCEFDKHNFSILKNPVSAISHALKRREKNEGDVVRITRGRWALKAFYTEEELLNILKGLNGRPERDADYHSARVRAALKASRLRGVIIGRRPFEDLYTPEVIREFRQMRAGGASIKVALKAISMPMPTYKKYKSLIEAPDFDAKKYIYPTWKAAAVASREDRRLANSDGQSSTERY
ncbi:MAG: hypothetical protein H7Y60_09460 [Rhodospirillaceae bacterium]|nr:hypothetical protein [Rhodospirillales bacterium]